MFGQAAMIIKSSEAIFSCHIKCATELLFAQKVFAILVNFMRQARARLEASL